MEFDFSTSTTVESLDKVPQDFHGLYKENEEGKFVLDSEHPGVKSAVAAVTRLNTSLKAARAEAKANKRSVDLSALAEYGETPEAIAEAVTAKINELTEDAKKKGGEALERQVNKIKQDLATAHAKDLQGRDARIQALTGQLHGILVENEARSALSDAGAIDAELALPFIRTQVAVEEKDGKFLVHVVDGAKDVRYSGVTGAPMTIKELVEEMKANTKYGPLFKSEAPAGGGTTPSGTGARRTVPAGGKAEMSSTDKIAAGLAKRQFQRGRRA